MVTVSAEVAGHLAKAEEFLAAARQDLDERRPNAAVSNAAIAGINVKDALCLALTGRTQKTENHTAAQAELRKVGGPAGELATTLGRLIRLKSKAQYQSGSASATDAAHAVAWAGRLVEGAQRLIN